MARGVDARVSRARKFRRQPTDAERNLWQKLRKLPRSSAHFRRQATIGPYFADFACHTNRLIVEVDGGQHSEAIDQDRTAFLKSEGYRVVRFWNNDVLNNIEGVVEVIAAKLSSVTPPTPDPSPPQKRGEGS